MDPTPPLIHCKNPSCRSCQRISVAPRSSFPTIQTFELVYISVALWYSGVSQCACVQLYGFHSSFIIVCFSYTEDYRRSQHRVVSPTVCSTHCSCATNIHLIPASGDDEVYHMTVSRFYSSLTSARMYPDRCRPLIPAVVGQVVFGVPFINLPLCYHSNIIFCRGLYP